MILQKIIDNSEDWKEDRLSSIAYFKNGLAMQKHRPKENDKGLPVLKIKELGAGCCTVNSDRCTSDIDQEVYVRDGDLIFSWSGTLLLKYWAGGDAGLNQHLFKVTSEKYPSWFYYMWTSHYLEQFISLAKDRATTMGHIKRSALDDAIVKIPDDKLLNTLTLKIQPLIDFIIKNKVENRKLAEIRDNLLPKLMSGKIDVSQVNIKQ